MKIRLTLVAILLAFAGAAHGVLKAIEQAYELSLTQMTWPGSEGGILLLRPCPGCKPETLRVTPATRYFIRPATTPVTLAEARLAARKAAGRRQASVYLYYDPKTRTVSRLVLDPAA